MERHRPACARLTVHFDYSPVWSPTHVGKDHLAFNDPRGRYGAGLDRYGLLGWLGDRKATGANLGGAYIKVNQVDFSAAVGSSGHITTSADAQTANTWSPAMEESHGADGIWYLNPYGTKNANDNKTTFIPQGWNRFYVLQAGYDARVFFRDHEYNQSCPIFGDKNPYSGGPYPYDLWAHDE